MSKLEVSEQIKESRNFFSQPGQQVLDRFAFSWVEHKKRTQIHDGTGAVLGINTDQGIRFFNVALAVLYSNEYTMNRWPKSRSKAIEQMQPGELVCYGFHKISLVFIKTRDAENIQLTQLEEIDQNGNPIPQEEEITSGKIAKIIGCSHKEQIPLAHFKFHDRDGFMIQAKGIGKELPSQNLMDDIRNSIIGN